jgi:hypothetical protein
MFVIVVFTCNFYVTIVQSFNLLRLSYIMFHFLLRFKTIGVTCEIQEQNFITHKDVKD